MMIISLYRQISEQMTLRPGGSLSQTICIKKSLEVHGGENLYGNILGFDIV